MIQSKAFKKLIRRIEQIERNKLFQSARKQAFDFVRSYRQSVVKIKQGDIPPCLNCKDIQIMRCALSSNECIAFKKYCKGGGSS